MVFNVSDPIKYHTYAEPEGVYEEEVKKFLMDSYYISVFRLIDLLSSQQLALKSIENLTTKLKQANPKNTIIIRNFQTFDITYNNKNFDKNLIMKIINDDFNSQTYNYLNKFDLFQLEINRKKLNQIKKQDIKNLIIITEMIGIYKNKFKLIAFMIFLLSIIASLFVLIYFKKIKPIIEFK